jgi:hypothetical protein
MPTVVVQDWSAWGAVMPLDQSPQHAFPRFLSLLSPNRAAALAPDFRRGAGATEHVPLKSQRPLHVAWMTNRIQRAARYWYFTALRDLDTSKA